MNAMRDRPNSGRKEWRNCFGWWTETIDCKPEMPTMYLLAEETSWCIQYHWWKGRGEYKARLNSCHVRFHWAAYSGSSWSSSCFGGAAVVSFAFDIMVLSLVNFVTLKSINNYLSSWAPFKSLNERVEATISRYGKKDACMHRSEASVASKKNHPPMMEWECLLILNSVKRHSCIHHRVIATGLAAAKSKP
jgi:hypothetical protein